MKENDKWVHFICVCIYTSSYARQQKNYLNSKQVYFKIIITKTFIILAYIYMRVYKLIN